MSLSKQSRPPRRCSRTPIVDVRVYRFRVMADVTVISRPLFAPLMTFAVDAAEARMIAAAFTTAANTLDGAQLKEGAKP